jgi:hypothetical protein
LLIRYNSGFPFLGCFALNRQQPPLNISND